MRALYRETFEDMQKLSTAIYAYTHPGDATVPVYRGVREGGGIQLSEGDLKIPATSKLYF